jgi:hypothetical protein
MIAETFNNCFLSVAENNNAKNEHNVYISCFPAITHSQYLLQTFTNTFLNIKIKSLSTKEVVNIINLSNKKILMDMMKYPLKY